MEPEPRTALDKLIDGETVTVASTDGEDLGYLMGWTNAKIPTWLRAETEATAPRMELEDWRVLARGERRPLPDDLLLIFWEGLPLAVWVPAGIYHAIAPPPN